MPKVSKWIAKSVLTLSAVGLVIASQNQTPADKANPAAAQSAAAAPTQETAAPSGPATYVGSETCQACHEDIFKAFQTNRHHAVEAGSKKWKGQACESCHGPGSKHAESADAKDIRQPAKLTPMQSEQICLSCHKNSMTHSGRVQSGHGRHQVACVSCHSVHKPEAEQITSGRNKAINAQCAACHAQTWAEFQKPHKHFLPEGAMSCVDCHNPHGSFLPRMVNTVNANEPACIRCHSDKRGPFAFEHPPVKTEGCRGCHEPHGSVNPRMLRRSEERFLCLECHSNLGAPTGTAQNRNNASPLGSVPPAFHDIRSPRFRECSVCHIKVHGSHVDRSFLR